METHPLIIAPSILAADFGGLHEEVLRAEAAGADWLHLDVMDGHFVDNISFGPAFVNAVAKVAGVPLDVHLMIDAPGHYLPRFAQSARNITIHVEVAGDIGSVLKDIRAAGLSCGLSLKPGTPFERVEPFLGQIDLLLVMTVEPGFGGQPFMIETMPKVKAAAEARAKHGYGYRIEVDGGITAKTAAIAAQNGADTLVAGTSVFAAPDMAAAMREIRQAAA